MNNEGGEMRYLAAALTVLSFISLLPVSGCLGDTTDATYEVVSARNLRVQEPGVTPFIEVEVKVRNTGKMMVRSIELECEGLGEDGMMDYRSTYRKIVEIPVGEARDIKIEMITEKAYDIREINCRAK